MTDDTCSLCDLPTPDPPVALEGVEGAFCCRGCAAVARTLGDAERDPADLDTGPDTDDVDGERAFLAVDGMHCATCEAFVESRAVGCGGVRAADASYASGMVRVVYDDDALSEETLRDRLSGTGYRARAVTDEADDGTAAGRILVGGFFGMMTMLWYALFLYPTYVGFEEYVLFDIDGAAGRYLLGNVWLFATVVLGYTGYPILRGAYVSLRAGRPNMDLLVALAAVTAYVYSTGVVMTGGIEVYYDVSVVIVVVVTVGTHYEGRVRERAAGHLTELTEERVEEARRRRAGGTEPVPIADLDPGEEVVVRAGERVPVDGTVAEGTGAVDESLVTGESLPVRRTAGDEVIGGALLADGGLVVEVGENATSTADRLVSTLWSVQSGRGGAQRLADRLAAAFVPLVLAVAAVAVAYALLTGAAPTAAFLTGLAVLVVSCPCALGLATPLAVAAGVRESLERGVVVTSGEVFERAVETDVVVLDKTGTLTTGAMAVGAVHADGTTEREVLDRAAAVEQFAEHPVGRAITDRAAPPAATVEGFERHPGRGVSADVDGERVVVGRRELFDAEGWSVPEGLADRAARAAEDGRVPSLVGWGGRARGLVVAGDRPRDGWEAAVADLADAGRRVVVLTGDGEAAARPFRESPHVDETFAGVPPEGKAAVVERLQAEGTVTMVGDGSNDAPALAAADLGIALESGTRLAADAADVVVTTGELATVPSVFELTRAARGRVRANLGWAFLYNAVAVPLAAVGLINPLFAALAMAASSLLVVANSSRSMPVGGTETGLDRGASTPLDGEVSEA
ncbi:MAG: heavy metal translocating P-type ATPase [Haloarculaceae archaeon]